MQVDAYINLVIQREGGYSNNPADKGGPTKFGITEHVARANGYAGKMADLPIQLARQIYKDQYWNDPGFEAINLRLPKVAEELLDTGVNMGPQRAAKMLQRALNVLNRGVTDYPNLNVDGALGRMTLFALDSLIAKRGATDVNKVLLRLLDAQQGVRYMEIAEANPSQEEFMFGWASNRLGV